MKLRDSDPAIRTRRDAARPIATAIAALLAIAIGPGGASAADKRFVLVDSIAAVAPDPARATVWLLRETFVRKSALPPERIYLDGRPIAMLPQQSYVVVSFEPGRHALTGLVGAPPLVLEFRAGKSYLFRLREVVDDNDVLSTRWLLDRPEVARDLVAGAALPLVRLTPKGEAELAKKAGNPWARGTALAPRAAADSAFTEILFEHPLDPLNLRRDFSVHTGELELLEDRIHYFQKKKRGDVTVSIPYRRITDLRYGGTRFTGTTPWIDVVYESDEGPLRASFAPATADDPEAVYNQLFAELTERWHDSGASAPEPAAPPRPR